LGIFYSPDGKLREIRDNETQEFVETIYVRCPHLETALKIIHKIRETREAKDSIGGTVIGVI